MKLLLALLLCAAPAAAVKNLTWGADATGGAPYILRDPANPEKIIGFEVDLAAALAAELGTKPEFVQNQWDSLVPGLKRGNYDVVINGIEITEDRKAEIDFSDPYYLADETLTVRKDTYDINALPDLKGRKAGTLKACLAERILNATPGVQVLGYDSQTTLYDDLANGRIDAVLLDEPAAIYYGGMDRRLRNLPGQFGALAYGIGVRKGDEKLLNKINVALRALMRRGELRRIYERWGIWNPLMEAQFKEDPAAAQVHEEPVQLRAYEASRGLQRGWRAKAEQYASYVPLLAKGAVITVGLSIFAMFFAIIIGLFVALVRLYAPPPFPLIALGYVEFVRGTPLLIQLFFIYYGLPNIGIRLQPFAAAVIGLALNYGAYEAEVYRGGIIGIPHSQMEAAFALGMTRGEALRHVIIPQALRLVLPPITNDFISLLKDSSLVSVITMVELTRVYGQLAATYYDYFGIGLLTAAAYFLIGLPFVRLSRWAETRLAFDRRPAAAPKPAAEA
jgi:polar amino acid transport system substrate-binding protein